MGFEFVEPQAEVQEPATETTEVENADTIQPDNTDTDSGTTEQPDEGSDSTAEAEQGAEESTDGAEEGQEGDSQSESQEGESEDVTYYWGGDMAVEVEIDQDIAAALKEKGLDAVAITKELYAEGNKDFTLSEETMGKLYEAFGKPFVDSYLRGLRAHNEAVIRQMEFDSKQAEADNAQRFTDMTKDIGGEEGWNKLESWALEVLTDEELAAFNAVMESGNAHLQMYAIKELESRRVAAQGQDKVELIEPTAPAPAVDNSPLSREDYMRAMAEASKTYARDRVGYARAMEVLDARRRAGMAKGI